MTQTDTDFFEGLVLSDVKGNEVQVNLDLEYSEGPGTKIVDKINVHFVTVGDMGNKLGDEIMHAIWLESNDCYDYSRLREEDIWIQ